jgi:putative iron-regulated protein
MKPMKFAFSSKISAFAPLLLSLAALGCSDDKTEGQPEADVIANYAALVSANYADSLKTAQALDSAIHELTEHPSDSTLEDAKDAWLASRDPYGESEAYRFYQGPIDNDDADDEIADGPEGLINSWPLDESYIDYVTDANGMVLNGGIINSVDEFPKIDEETLAAANTKNGESETSISTGYHAVEFLLWGQDHDPEGPGDRPYTDFVSGDEGTAENQDRRAQYLRAVSDLLVEDLTLVNEAWLDGKSNYRADFLKMPARVALGKIMLGMGSLAGAELSHERMQVAYDLKDQEDEHSCFSDNTLADLHNNAKSVQNVLLGKYGDVEGPGIDSLIEAKDAALAKQLRAEIQDALDNIDALKDNGGRFDQIILEDDDSEGRVHLLAAIRALGDFKDTLLEAAQELGVELNFEE